ncbi:MAG: hypothetical protein RLN90_09730 [Balneolaceae bacterium]
MFTQEQKSQGFTWYSSSSAVFRLEGEKDLLGERWRKRRSERVADYMAIPEELKQFA